MGALATMRRDFFDPTPEEQNVVFVPRRLSAKPSGWSNPASNPEARRNPLR